MNRKLVKFLKASIWVGVAIGCIVVGTWAKGAFRQPAQVEYNKRFK